MQNLLYRAEIFNVEPKVEFFNSIGRFKPLASHTMDLNCKLQMDLVKATNTPLWFLTYPAY